MTQQLRSTFQTSYTGLLRLQLAWIREIAIIGVKKFNWVNLDIYSVGLMGCYTARWAPIQFSQIQGCNALELWMQSPEGICLGKGLVNINCKINELLLG